MRAIKAIAAAQGRATAGLCRRFRPGGRCAGRRARHLLGALGRREQGFHGGDDAGSSACCRSAAPTAPDQRKAHFVSALCVAWPDGHLEEVEARVDGTLVWPPRGTAGFGYDPMFLPDGHTRTFGEMTSDREARPAAARPRPVAPRPRLRQTGGDLPWLAPNAITRSERLRRLRALAVLPVEMPVLRLQQPCPPRADRRGALCRAPSRARSRRPRRARRAATVSSIFLGGGTPSLMQPQTVGAILDAIGKHWRVARRCRGDAGSQSDQRRGDALSRLSRSRRQPRLARRAGARRRRR